MKLQTLLFTVICALGVTTSVAADSKEQKTNLLTEEGMVSIEWRQSDEYRDIEAVVGKQSSYEQSVFTKLTKELSKDAAKILKPNQQLVMIMTDVDLAGDVRPTFGATINDIRLVKEIFPPRLTFSYQVIEGDQVVIAGNEKLTDLGFMSSLKSRNKNESLRYEINLLEDWLKKSIAPKL